MKEYKTVAGYSSCEMIEKRSRFIGYIKPVRSSAEAVAFIDEIRARHRDATHNVYAYVIREEGIERHSDDNEPQGTAGIPVLDVIKRRSLTDCVIVVTRYFGGVLLGAGGLVRAYSTSASLAVDAAGEMMMIPCSVCSLTCPYVYYGKIPALVSKYSGEIDESSFADEISVSFHIPVENLSSFNEALSELSGGKCRATEIEKEYFGNIIKK